MDQPGTAEPRGWDVVVPCPRRVYPRRKVAGRGLKLTPKPELGKTEALRGLKGRGKEHVLQKITEKAELSRPGGSSGPPSQLSVKGEITLQEKSPGKETAAERITPLSESVTDDFNIDSSSDSELVSGLSLQQDVSSCVLNCSDTESYREYKSIEENLSSFSSPELIRGSDYFDWEHPKLEDYSHYKNSTFLDSSNAVVIERALQLSDLSAILSASSEDYEKCHRKIVLTLEDQKVSPKPKYTSTLASVVDNSACEVVLTEKTGPPTTKKTKKKAIATSLVTKKLDKLKIINSCQKSEIIGILAAPKRQRIRRTTAYQSENLQTEISMRTTTPEKESDYRDPSIQTKLNVGHLKTNVPLSHCKLALENSTSRSVSEPVLPQCLEPVLKESSSISDKQSKAPLTSTPSSETVDFVIDLSPVQDVSFEELFPKVSNYVNSNEIVSVSSSQENSSNEFPSNTPEICCIIRASPGTRQMKNKGITVKKKYSLPKDTPLDIIMKTNGRT
ncbi:meiosis-specific kinetochore protein [Nannospalax galili]|uniref:meiosis-specific kinetochore protein n=1 Tax=Nannospalax galili TaxID=1026970 RepID=UPI00111C48B2|nr:meiosis-specific kinetochore protein [Nannospalax galili]